MLGKMITNLSPCWLVYSYPEMQLMMGSHLFLRAGLVLPLEGGVREGVGQGPSGGAIINNLAH